VHTHVYYNAKKASAAQERVFAEVALLREEADPAGCAVSGGHRKYLSIRKSSKAEIGYTIKIRDDVINGELKHSGWLVLVSNDVASAKEALRIYRAKDVVEKGSCAWRMTWTLGG